ncbi:MAG: molybdopterin dinucleotide binding domain-containing protein [Nitrospiraceae bacterium]
MTALAGGLGCEWSYESPQDIQNEIMKLLPGYYNLGQPRKIAPKPDAYLSNGYATFLVGRYGHSDQAAGPSKSHSFRLTMGQLLYHSGKLSSQASGLIKIAPNSGKLRMNGQDMERLGLSDGARVRVSSAQGSLDMGVQADHALLPGACFFPEHFNEPPVKDLIAVEVDAVTGVPSFKFTEVSIEKL